MGRVAAAGEEQDLRCGDLALNGLDLGQGAVLVVFTLDDEDGASDCGKILFDIPLAKVRIEPDVVPAAKNFFDVIVIAGELLRQVGGRKQRANCSNAPETCVFDEDMRGLENERVDVLGMRAGVYESNGGAVAVAEKNGLGDLELAEKFGKDDLGFVVHEIDGAGRGEAVGFAMTVAGVDEELTMGGVRELLGKILPHGEGAEAFVKHHNCRKIGMARLNPGCFEPAAIDAIAKGDRRRVFQWDTTAGANGPRTGVSRSA